MFSRPQFRLLAIFALFLAIAQASWFDGALFGRHQPQAKAIEKKQVLSIASSIGSALSSLPGTGTTSSATTTSSDTTSIPTTSSSATSSKTSSPSSSVPETSSSSSSTQDTSTKTTETKTTAATTSKATSASQSVVLVTSVVTEGGSTVTSVSSSTSTAPASPTADASLTGDQKPSSGMSSKTKGTVIGVVVGIGGAIILVGLGIVAWRIWGRKDKNEDDDGLMGFRSGSAGQEKSSTAGASGTTNPFQSTLETYHGPPKQVNASSNF